VAKIPEKKHFVSQDSSVRIVEMHHLGFFFFNQWSKFRILLLHIISACQ